MSKRFADAQLGSSRYGGSDGPETPDDPPRKATAAQLARRNIKPMKGRPASRSTSPSKFPSPSLGGSFDGLPQQAPQQQAAFSTGSFGAPNQAIPPIAPASFTFGEQQASQASNPFSQANQSQSFGGFGASQQTNTPTFSPSKVDFNFGGPAPSSNTNGSAPAAFAFGGNSPAKPAATNGSLSFGASTSSNTSNVFGIGAQIKTGTSMFGGAQPTPATSSQGLTDAEVQEIENAGPRLAAEGKLGDLEKIVREASDKYRNAPDLGGFTPRELPEHAQRKLLDFCRGKTSQAPTPAPTPTTSFQTGSQTTSSAPAFSFQSSSSATPANPAAPAASSNPFANLGRTPSSSSTPSISFGAKPVESTSQAPAFGGFGTPKPAEEVSYPKLNGASTPASQSEAPVSSSASNMFNFTKAADTSKPASSGLGTSMFTKPTETPAPASNSFSSSLFNKPPTQTSQSTPFKGFGSAAASSTPEQNAAPASAPVFSIGGASSTAAKQDSASAFTPFKFGAAASSTPAAASSTPAAAGPVPAAASSVTAALQQEGFPRINFGTSNEGLPEPIPASTFKSFGSSSGSESTPSSGNLQQTSTITPSSRAVRNRELNEALRAHLVSANPTQDWSHIMRYFLAEHSMINNDSQFDPITDPINPFKNMTNGTTKRKAEEEVSREDINKRSKASTDFNQSNSSSSSSPNKPFSQTASLFNDILNTPPKSSAAAPSLATTPTPQAPAVAAPSFGGFSPAPPTPKVAAAPAETPRANPFATLTKVNKTPAAPVSETPKPAANGFQFKASTAADPAKTDTQLAPSPFQFKPVPGNAPGGYAIAQINAANNGPKSAPATPAFQLPKFGSGAPSTTNFLSSFGSRAAEEEKKEREKRKAEDMDSDDDEEEWERKDAEEQAAKRKKLLDEANSASKLVFKPITTAAKPVFSFGGANKAVSAPATTTTSTSSSNIFGHLSGKQSEQDNNEDDEEESDEDAEADETTTPAKPAASTGGSLFDRVEKPSNGDKPAASSTSFKFGEGSSNSFGSNASPAADNTWKGVESTPIKFGGLAQPTDSGSSTPNGSPAKAAFGGFTATSTWDKPGASTSSAPKFNFGGASTSTTGLFGASNGSSETNKTTPASPAASGPNASVFASPATKTTGFTFGGPKTTPGLSAPAPAIGGSNTSSVFGDSAATSRSATPAGAGTGTGTDAENSGKEGDGEPSDEPKDTPQNDLTALSASQIAENDVLFESKAKLQQFLKPADGPADAKATWHPRGMGIFRILRNKESGKCTVLMRMTPGGKILLNFGLLKKDTLNGGAYIPMGKMCRMAVPDESGRMETWAVQFGTVEKVKEVADTLSAGQPEA